MATSDDQVAITIGFSELADADANVCAGELLRWLRGEVEDGTIERVRADPANQDLGTVLVAIVSSAAAVQIARGVREWLRREARGTVLDWSSKGLVARGLTSADMAKVIEHLARSASAGEPVQGAGRPEAPGGGPAAE